MIPQAKRQARSGHEMSERIDACRKRVRRSRSSQREQGREGVKGAAGEELTGERGRSLPDAFDDEQQGERKEVPVAKKSKIFWLEQMLAQEVDRRRRLHARFSVQEEAGRV